jgi:hypothetical protein
VSQTQAPNAKNTDPSTPATAILTLLCWTRNMALAATKCRDDHQTACSCAGSANDGVRKGGVNIASIVIWK